MLKYLRQNKQTIIIAFALFIVSTSTLLFFVGSNGEVKGTDLKTDVIENHNNSATQEEEKNFRHIANNKDDSLVVLNLDGTIDFATQDFEERMGYSQTEIHDQVFFDLLNPEDFTSFLGVFSKVLHNHEPISLIGPYRIRDKAGEYHTNIGATAPYLLKGKLEKIILTLKDITAKNADKKTEKQSENDHKDAEQKDTKESDSKKIQNEKNQDARLMAENTTD